MFQRTVNEGFQVQPGLWSWLRWLLAGIGVAWALSLLWWALLEPASASDDVYELVIPPGTAAAVARGEPAPFIPNSLGLGRSKKLVVLNHDSAPHKFGTWTIPPGGSAEITANPDSGEVSCTVHPDGSIDVTVDERPAFLATVVSALGVGIPIGLVAGFASYTGSRLRVAATRQSQAGITTPPE